MNIINKAVTPSTSSVESPLQSRQELYFSRFAIAQMNDGLLWVDSVGKIVWVNRALSNSTEYSQEELLSLKISELDLDLSEAQWTQYKEESEQEEFTEVESYIYTKKGHKLFVKLKLSALEYEGSKYYCILLQDISQHKRAIAAWQKSNSNLERKIEERTAELAEVNRRLESELTKVRQIVDRVQTRDRQRSEFVSLIAHELKAPLNIISFVNSLLQHYGKELPDIKRQDYLEQIKTGVEQLDRPIEILMSLGKLEAEGLNFDAQKIDLSQFCRDLIAQLQIDTEEKTPINFSSRGKHRQIALNPQLLRSILRNLLDNAIKYSPADRAIDLQVEYKSQELVFRVKDRGIGISEADRENLFKPFKRGKNVGDIAGHGLGLAIVRQLVEIYQGRIEVFGELGKGTTMTIVLPLSDSNLDRSSK